MPWSSVLRARQLSPPAALSVGRRSVGGVDVPRTLARLALGGALVLAGTSHLTVGREEFRAQVPPWFPADPDAVVVVSGWVEIALGLALLLAPGRHRWLVGWVAALFFVAIFPGNVSQYLTRTDGFGLDSDRARAARLLFQPLLVLWALWSTRAWSTWRERRGLGENPAPDGRRGQWDRDLR